MSSYQPFLISNFRQGLLLGLEPWLLPQDAFAKLKNAYLEDGAIVKRKGYEDFDRFVYAVAGEVLDTGDGSTKTFTGTVSNVPLRAGDLSVTDGTESFTDNSDGTLTGDAGGTGTINYTTGAVSVTFNANVTNLQDITMGYDYYPGNAITGIFTYIKSDGTKQLLASDTKRVCNYASSKLEDLPDADVWTGTQANLVSAAQYLDIMYFANGKDQMRQYNGTALTAFNVDIDGGGAANDLDYAKFVMVAKERVIVFYTSESGTVYPQRVRWCTSGSPTDWTNDEYIDCPTGEWIRAVAYIGDDIGVWFDDSFWMFKYTGNAAIPFNFERIDSQEGAVAGFSPVVQKNKAFALSKTRLTLTDGFDLQAVDHKIPKFVLSFDQDNADLCYGINLKELDQIWLLYPYIGSSSPDRVLVLNYQDKAFADFRLSMTCLGFYDRESSVTWTNAVGTWGAQAGVWIEGSEQAGYPELLGGSSDGYLYRLNSGSDDDGSAIEMEVETGRWNPYAKKGFKARLGFIDFLIESDEVSGLSIDFYLDFNQIAYETQTLDFDQDAEKVWIRVFSGAIGASHKIRLYKNTTGETPKIHAVMPWFKKAGRLHNG